MRLNVPNAIASSSGFNGHVLDVPRDSEGDSDHEAVTKSRQIENGHARSEDGDNDDDNNKDGWTVETFKDQPLGKSNSTIHMLKTLTDKLKEVIKKTEDGMVKTTDNARAMEDASPDDGQIVEFETGLQRAIELRQIVQIKIDVLDEMQMRMREGESLVDAGKQFKQTSSKRAADYMAKSKRMKCEYAQGEYIDFRTSIWEINHPSGACPPMSTFLPKTDEDESDDEDFEIGGNTQNYRCPVTMLPLKDTVTRHSYSREGIEGIFTNAKRNKRPARCPVAGCNVQLTNAHLIDDKHLQKRADEFEKRRARRENDSDEEAELVDVSQDD
ncbi:MAG: hypothetical protein TREMPRED_003935 [Tremellales sp. Tagirdzhanova-0007]|nr:MAG: hypothetical protein TREMPRED_003935 [Tremellales sp. Tagirdzhanova-0007]